MVRLIRFVPLSSSLGASFGLAITLAAGVVLALTAAAAQQQSGNVHRIGLLGTHSHSTHVKGVVALFDGLRDLGYVEGKNLAIEYRWAEGKYDRLPNLVAELVALQVDVIVTMGGTLLRNPLNRTTRFEPLENTARSLKVELQPASVRKPDEFERLFSTMAEGVDALVVAQDALLNANAKVIADLAAKKRLPSSGTKDFAAGIPRSTIGAQPTL